ncbi:DUF167 domain-containing protein [Thermodesulfobacteriota bacterium]
MDCIADTKNNNLALNVYVQPRASMNRVAGLHGSAIKVCVTAPPAENKANAAVVHFIAGLFRIPKSSVSIKSGRQGRNKKLLIKGLALKDAQGMLSMALSKTRTA